MSINVWYLGVTVASGQFSIVVALYNAEAYLDAFMFSLERQKYPLADLDVIIIDDGSTDDSFSIARRWAKRYPDSIRTQTKSNGGPGSARNVGLTLARNEWITMCDPDDILDASYFSEVDSFLTRDSKHRAQMLTTRLVEFKDGDIQTSHTHPLNWKFKQKERLLDLDENPEYVHLSGGTAFVRRDIVRKYALSFDELIRPKFEDANFLGRYLARTYRPVVGIIPSAKYFYRKQRRNGNSLVQGAWEDPRSFYEVPVLGYYGMMNDIRQHLGRVPVWAQSMVLYDLLWAYASDKSMHGGTGAMTLQQRERMHESLDLVMTLIDERTVREFTTVSLGWAFYNMLMAHYKAALPAVPVIIKWKNDPDTLITKFSYMFSTSLPREVILVGGKRVNPISIKTVEHSLFGRVLVKERVFTLPTADTVIYLDGARARVTGRTGLPRRNSPEPSRQPELVLEPAKQPDTSPNRVGKLHLTWHEKLPRVVANTGDRLAIQALMADVTRTTAAKRMAARVLNRSLNQTRQTQTKLREQELVKAAQSDESSKYRAAWVLMDRIDRADDNAEHLYRYLRDERPDINAWFLLHRESRDWQRLAADGFKLVAYGSDESVKLVLNAAYKISSHADRDVQYPIDASKFGRDPGKIVFLQHGVTKDDLSRWINPKQLSLMITATHDEYESIAGSDNSYKWTKVEIKLTGFPRHDSLSQMAAENPLSLRNNILIAPTWRQYLSDECSDQDPRDAIEGFEASEYGTAWLSLLRSLELEALAAKSNSRIRFLGHPNLSRLLPHIRLPDYVDVISYDDISVQQELVNARVIISDFSSISFDAAYAGTNVLYYHFDGDEIFKGGHVYRKGYFDYQRDGFGPVSSNLSEVLKELTSLADRNFTSDPGYDKRISSAFPHWDGKCSARVTAEIENLGRPWDTQVSL